MSLGPDAAGDAGGALPEAAAAAAPGTLSARVTIHCPRCSHPAEVVNGESAECPSCGRQLAAFVFPRAVEARPPARLQAAAVAGDAVCFFHASAAAERACDACGRYVCHLCDVELEGRHYCPTCVENPGAAAPQKALTSSEFQYDSMVLSLSLLWILVWPSWILVMPYCLIVTVRHWKSPRRYLLPRSPWRFVAGDLLLFTLSGSIIFLIVFAARV